MEWESEGGSSCECGDGVCGMIGVLILRGHGDDDDDDDIVVVLEDDMMLSKNEMRWFDFEGQGDGDYVIIFLIVIVRVD